MDKFTKNSLRKHDIYQLNDRRTGSTFSDVMEINTLELPKLPPNSDNTKLWDWLKFLKASREEDYQMLEQRSPQIKKAVGVLKELSENERTRHLEEAREKARWDEEARKRDAVEQTRREEQARMKETVEQNSIKIVKNLIKENVPFSIITKATKLTEQEIEALAKELR